MAKSDNKSPKCTYGGGGVAGLGVRPKFYHFFGGFPLRTEQRKIAMNLRKLQAQVHISTAAIIFLNNFTFAFSVFGTLDDLT